MIGAMNAPRTAPTPAAPARDHVVVVPVKPPAVGKSRLAPAPDVRRRELAGAFALDTVTAVLATPGVARALVVTDDAAFSRDLVALGCESVPDGATGDLNATLNQTVAEAHRRWPTLRPLALCADLPALRPSDLAAAIAAAPEDGPWFVADAHGLGTTLYAAAYDDFAPRFGVGSRAAHLALGAHEISGGLTSLRCDVDDLEDLRAAIALGVGEHTARVVASWEIPPS